MHIAVYHSDLSHNGFFSFLFTNRFCVLHHSLLSYTLLFLLTMFSSLILGMQDSADEARCWCPRLSAILLFDSRRPRVPTRPPSEQFFAAMRPATPRASNAPFFPIVCRCFTVLFAIPQVFILHWHASRSHLFSRELVAVRRVWHSSLVVNHISLHFDHSG